VKAAAGVPQRERSEYVRGFLPETARSRGKVHVVADTYPSALNEPTEDGMLPLHVADRYATSVGVVRCLATASPGALTKRTSSRWLPIH
jgi:hypothetical protein